MANKHEYIVNVGNIGNVHCDSLKEAEDRYKEYVEWSKSGMGRAGGESVILMVDGEPVKEHFGEKDLGDSDEFKKGGRVPSKKRTLMDLIYGRK